MSIQEREFRAASTFYVHTDWDERVRRQSTLELLGELKLSYSKQLTPGVIAERFRLKNEITRRLNAARSKQAATA